MAIAFLLLAVAVWAGLAIVARNATQAVTDAAVRGGVRPGTDLVGLSRQAHWMIGRTVPGAEATEVAVANHGGILDVGARLRWSPPGPVLAPLTVEVHSRLPMIMPP